jgi:hypothetical protein
MQFTHRFCIVTHTRPTGYASGLTPTQYDVCFLQRPLCKVDPKLFTDLLMLAGYKPSYPQATVDNCGQTPVDKRPAARLAGGGGAGREGPQLRYPRAQFLIFCFLFFDLRLPLNANHHLQTGRRLVGVQ